jgi:hypothetical protein
LCSILDDVRAREALDLVDKFTDWEWFQSLASELISPSIQILSSEKAEKAAYDFATSVALIYRMSTRKPIVYFRNATTWPGSCTESREA